MRFLTRTLVSAALFGAAFSAGVLPTVATAQTFPNRPITLVASAGTGGLIDVAARAYAAALATELGQPVVVDNRGGAGGVVGAGVVAKAAPDGYTICLCFNGPVALVKASVPNLPYDIDKAFMPVARVYALSIMLAVGANSPIKTVDELLAAARAKPGTVSYGHTGVGGGSNLGIEEIGTRLNIKFNGVAYPSEAKIIPDLAGDRLDFGAFSPMTAKTQSEAGAFRIIGSMGSSTPIAGVPLLGERPELKGFVAPSWAGFFLPAGTPEPIVQRYYDAIQKVGKQPFIAERLKSFGVEPVLNESREDFARAIESEKQRAIDTMKQIGSL